MDIANKQQAAIKELRAKLEQYKAAAEYERDVANTWISNGLSLRKALNATITDLKWYKRWTYVQLVLLVLVAIKEIML